VPTAKSKPRKTPKEPENEAEGYFRAYEGYSTVLRTWLVAYGIGAPVLLFTNDHLATAISRSPLRAVIAACFLSGVGLHVLLAAINKNVMWMLYWGEQWPELQERFWYKVSAWISYQFWIDMLVDVGCLLLFGWATLMACRVVLA
jgi:hypothetical protein